MCIINYYISVILINVLIKLIIELIMKVIVFDCSYICAVPTGPARHEVTHAHILLV